MKIGVAEGHNSNYNSGAHGIKLEDELTFEVSEEVIRLLKKLDYEVIDLVKTKRDGLIERVNKANNADLDLAVFIHFNAYNGQAYGTECCVYSNDPIANNICNEISALGYYNRGVKIRKDLYVLNSTVMPAILIECCFCDNVLDMKLYDKTTMAKAIVKGITGEEVIDDNKDYKAMYYALKDAMQEVIDNV